MVDWYMPWFMISKISQKYFREYLGKNKNIFKNILGCESRDNTQLIYAKNQTS